MYIDFTFILINHYIPIHFYIQILACLLACMHRIRTGNAQLKIRLAERVTVVSDISSGLIVTS